MNIFAQFPELIVGCSRRSGGVSPPPLGMNLSFSVGDSEQNVIRNRELFFATLGLTLDQLAIPGQVHSTTVRIVATPGRYEMTDGLITQTRSLALCVSIADCQPVLLYDPVTRTVAGVHSGWRGTQGKILERAVTMMQSQCGVRTSDLYAWLGPAAGACCYEVGEEVADQFDGRYVIRMPDRKPRLDIAKANMDMLAETGVLESRMSLESPCTIHNPEDFHSFRRDGSKSGRMMAVIGIRQDLA